MTVPGVLLPCGAAGAAAGGCVAADGGCIGVAPVAGADGGANPGGMEVTFRGSSFVL